MSALVHQLIVYSPTVLAGTNFMAAGMVASSESSGGLASSGLVGWLWSEDLRNNMEVKYCSQLC